MLTNAENELLTAVDSETPMGELLRRYWIPALLSADLPEADCTPKRVQLLGENFVAFRDTNGEVGVLDEACPHRGASLALGRVEDCGIRCLYHGWKFGTDGTIQDTPNMPNPQYKNRFKAPAYPVREAGDIIWVYLGPTDKEPAFPHYPMMDVPAENRVVTSVFMDCNWFQVMEGGIDSSHVGILHADVIQAMRNGLDVFHNSNVRHFNTDDNAPALEIGDTEFGFHYAAIRSGSGTDAGTRNVRVTPFILPYSTMIPPGTFQNLYTPVDYGTTQWFIVTFNPDGPLDHDEVMQLLGLDEPGLLDEERRFNANVENRFFQSPEKMKDGSFSGMRGLIWEDAAVQISMGTVIDRTREKVVPADLAVLRARRLFLESLRRMEKGESPIGAELADSSGIFSPEAYVAEGEPWTSLVPGHKLTNHSAGVDAGRP
ncbi:Rieske 2Fe-2S domain-containing protein [Rhodococcus koreensis]